MSKTHLRQETIDWIERQGANYYGRRPWRANIIKRMQVLTGWAKMAKITMDSGTYEILIWQGWWSPARAWRPWSAKKDG